MLRYHLAQLHHPGVDRNALDDYLTNVRVFLSHSKHDDHGRIVAHALRTWLNDNANAAPFLDVRNIPAGVPFDSVLEHEVARSVMVAIYTDSYPQETGAAVRSLQLNAGAFPCWWWIAFKTLMHPHSHTWAMCPGSG